MNEKVLKCLYDIKIAIDEFIFSLKQVPKTWKVILPTHLPKLKSTIEKLIG